MDVIHRVGCSSKNADISSPLHPQLNVVWCSLWVSKLVAKALPAIFQTLIGVVSSGVKKYALVIKAIEVPISLVGWAIASLCSFLPVSSHMSMIPATQKIAEKEKEN